LINEYLDEVFPEIAMQSQDPVKRHAAKLWTKRIDQVVHPAAFVITYAIGPRTIILNQPEEVRERNIAEIPDPQRRATRRSVIDHGVKAPEFATAIRAFVDLIDAMEAQLVPGAWLAGETFGLADACILPYVLRLDQLAMQSLLTTSARPNVNDWYTRVQARPSYKTAVSDWLAEPVLQLFRTNGEAVWAEVEPLTRAE
ncbi:MAG: glutathione S-transferase, partial [Myxococcota bacterium]